MSRGSGSKQDPLSCLNDNQPFGGGLLRHPFWHKAVMLLLNHDDDDKTGTYGILLNRPSSHTIRLEEEEEEDGGMEFRVWYGGPVVACADWRDDDEATTHMVCLHSIQSESVGSFGFSTEVKSKVFGTTSWNEAKKNNLCKTAMRNQPTFGYLPDIVVGKAGQLSKELEDQCWIAAATDSETVLRQLKSNHVEPRDAGLDAWNDLMSKIRGEQDVGSPPETFHDLLLKEWARDQLMTRYSDGNENHNKPFLPNDDEDIVIRAGMMLRASSRAYPPFLLSEEDMHKSIVLGDQ